MDPVGVRVAGAVEATPEQRRWVELAAQLGPAQSHGAIEEAAKFVVGTVAVAGTVLTGFGLVAVDGAGGHGWSRVFGVTAVVASSVALVLALTYLQLGVTRLNVNNLVEVRRWYEARERGLQRVRAAQRLLLAGVVLASLATLSALLGSSGREPVVVLTREVGEPGVVVAGTVACDGCGNGRHRVRMLMRSGAVTRVCFEAVTGSSAEGKFGFDLPECLVVAGGEVSVSVDGSVVASMR